MLFEIKCFCKNNPWILVLAGPTRSLDCNSNHRRSDECFFHNEPLLKFCTDDTFFVIGPWHLHDSLVQFIIKFLSEGFNLSDTQFLERIEDVLIRRLVFSLDRLFLIRFWFDDTVRPVKVI